MYIQNYVNFKNMNNFVVEFNLYFLLFKDSYDKTVVGMWYYQTEVIPNPKLGPNLVFIPYLASLNIVSLLWVNSKRKCLVLHLYTCGVSYHYY